MHLKQFEAVLAERRNLICERLDRLSHVFDYVRPEGAYYVFPRILADHRDSHERGVLTVPDFIANAGGVICAAVEYAGGSETSALQTIEDKIRVNTAEVLETSSQQGITPREAAFRMAEERVRRAMALRRWY